MENGLRRALALIDAAPDSASARRAIQLELDDREERAASFFAALDAVQHAHDASWALADEILRDYADWYGPSDTALTELQLFLDTSDFPRGG